MSIATDAKALKARHADLLRGEPSFHEPEKDRRCDALDAARARLRGSEDEPDAAQMKLGDDQ